MCYGRLTWPVAGELEQGKQERDGGLMMGLGVRRLPGSRQSSLESGEETDSTTTGPGSRRSSESDSGVGNLSETEPRRVLPSGTQPYPHSLYSIFDIFNRT